jgi:undecaprenyl-diphosphatase
VNERSERWLARSLALDRQLSRQAASLVRSRPGWWSAWLLARSGDSYWWLAAGALFWWQGDAHWRGLGVRIIVMTLAAGLASGALKWITRRSRPAGATALPHFAFDRHSFPSGHATRTAGLVIVLGTAAPWAWALAPWAVAVGVGRVALRAHFASDIVAGWLLGALLGCILVVLWL